MGAITPEFVAHIKKEFREEHGVELTTLDLRAFALTVLQDNRKAWIATYLQHFSPELIRELVYSQEWDKDVDDGK